NSNSSWTTAKTNVNNLGGYLASVTTSGEQNFVAAALFFANQTAWIGLNDETAEGTFVWANGEAFSYSNWDSSEPNDGNGTGEDYVCILSANGKWNDYPTGSSFRHVLEMQTGSGYEEPVTPLLISGLASGSTFPVGTSTVTWGYNGTNCSFTVTVTNPTPTVTCPENITTCINPVSYPTPTAFLPTTACLPTQISGFTFLGSHNGHHYFLSTSTVTWANAKIAATNLSGYLATVTTSAENTFLRSTIAAAGISAAWLGLTDEVTEGTFAWANGETFSYTNWETGEPNDSGGEDYGSMYTVTGKWNDYSSSATNRYVLELQTSGGYEQPVTPVLESGLASGSNFPVGTSTVTWGYGGSTCEFSVEVTDPAATFTNCPSNITTCVNPVWYSAPTATVPASDCLPTVLSGFTFIGAYNGHHYFRSNSTA
ncbi:MAG: lectin-like protein, partial [Bacteroidota bacterium]